MDKNLQIKEDLTWEDMITNAFKKLGGHAKYKDLYKFIKKNYPQKTNGVRDYKAQIRGCIERFSSDSDVFNKNKSKNKKNLYMLMGQKGDGHWGLREISSKDIISDNIIMDFSEDDMGFSEGKQMLKIHLSRERNPNVIKKAKDSFIRRNGNLKCQICDFDFFNTYGEIGKGFIEGHHILPVSELKENDITKVSDIVLVCSNCHKMLHRKRPWISMKDLKELININNSNLKNM